MLWFWRKLLLSHVHVVPELYVVKIMESNQFFLGVLMSWTQGSKRSSSGKQYCDAEIEVRLL
jgi:hypothetical protein